MGSLSNSNSVRVFKIGKKEDGSGNVGVLGTMDFPKVGHRDLNTQNVKKTAI